MIELTKDIYWTGHIDWELRNFHGYSTPYGSTYNAYLILDQQPTLIDSVKHYGYDQMLSGIKKLTDPSKIRYIISNHTEMDHSGSIAKLLKLCPKAEVICSPKGQEGLKRHFKADWNFKVVNSGDSLNIGKRTLNFVLTPMVHWPDSMATYSKSDEILFSNDAFGQHYASDERFTDQIGPDPVLKEAAKYYANIVMPYGSQTLKALQLVKGLKLDMICPSHGFIWRKPDQIKKIVSLYEKWASHETEKKAVIVYDTMWHSTEKMAHKLLELAESQGLKASLKDLKTDDPSDIMTEILSSKVVMVGSPILNNNIFPSVAGFLTYLKGLRPKKRFGFCFGSYGWAKAGFKRMEDDLKEAGIELIVEGKYFQYVPDREELESLGEVIEKVKKILEVC